MFDKPTPTPLPPGTPQFTIPSSYSLWASTDYAIQSWNFLGDTRTIIQAIILIAIIIVGIYVFMRFTQEFTRKDAEE